MITFNSLLLRFKGKPLRHSENVEIEIISSQDPKDRHSEVYG